MVYSIMSHSWSGLLPAALVGAIGWLVVRSAHRLGLRWNPLGWGRFAGYALYGLAGLMTIGSIVAIVRIGLAEREYKAPGRLVDVGGYKMHILAEGEPRGQPTVVWIPGMHGQGLDMHHLHKRMRAIGRSIIFDRPGTGWSDTGPFPRRVGQEADELAKLLKNAGETGPFILAGHSFGGLLAVNFARRHPDLMAGLVLLDATPTDQFAADFTGSDVIAGMTTMFKAIGFSKLMGFQVDLNAIFAKGNPDAARLMRTIDRELADVQPMMRSRERHPRYDLTTASILDENSAENFRRYGMNVVVYDGELGNIPVFVVIPRGDLNKAIDQMDADPALKRRALAVSERTRLRYLATSARSKLIHAPPGTGHNFVYERPDFTIGVVKEAIATTR